MPRLGLVPMVEMTRQLEIVRAFAPYPTDSLVCHAYGNI